MDVPALLKQIAAAAAQDELLFPTGSAAVRLQRLLDDPDCSVAQLVPLVQADPLLAARVVAVANSVAYHPSGRAISDVRSAVSRLGFDTLRVLAVAVVARQLEGMAHGGAHRQMAARLWQHTAHVAALARIIARRVTRVDPESAFFAGIIHELGGFYLISRAEGFPGLLSGKDGSLIAWEEGGAAAVGAAVLSRLKVPAGIQAAIEGLWAGYIALPPRTLADTLLLADQLAPVESPLSELAGTGREGIATDIDLLLDDRTLSGILAESAAEVASLIEALRV